VTASSRLRTIAGTFLMTCLLWLGGLAYWWSNAQPPVSPAAQVAIGPEAAAQSPGQTRIAYQPAPPVPVDLADVPPLIIPVQGVQRGGLSDTFTQAREGGARVHDAIDILAPLGTPVLAAASGVVEKLFTSAAGGLTIYVRCDDRRFVHYYAQDCTRGSACGKARRSARSAIPAMPIPLRLTCISRSS